jgi:NitT/TauT family transport system ATP-binding protein
LKSETLREPQPEDAKTRDHLVIEVENVSHTYVQRSHRVDVLDQVSLQIHEQEFVSIIGPSGCGKSTLLYLIAGFIRPTGGEIRYLGRPVVGPSRERGVVFQADAVFPWMTVHQNVEYGLKARRVPRGQRRRIVHEYLELVGLLAAEDLWPKQLSGGMRKRVDVARTYANGASTLLMDESFGSVDIQTKEYLQIALLDIWERDRKTALFVTHDIEEALFLGDRVIVLRGSPGKIVAERIVPFERPRPPHLRTSPQFQKMRQELADLLTVERYPLDDRAPLTERAIRA